MSKTPDIPIQEAAKQGNIEAVKQHLAAGADVNAKDAGGDTALHDAGGKGGGHLEIAKMLIEKGADVNAMDATGDTPTVLQVSKGLYLR